MTENIKTCIIVPTYNLEEYTIKCFESISKHSRNYVIIWVDDSSTLKSRQRVEGFLELNPQIKFEKISLKKNVGFIKAVNLGLKKSLKINPRFIVIQNNDTEVYKNWLETLTYIAEKDKKIGLVGPLANSAYWQTPKKAQKFVPGIRGIKEYEGDPREYSSYLRKKYGKKYFLVKKVHMLSFFCVLFKPELIKNIGFLSEEFGIGYGDDDDYSIRAQIAGYKLALAPGVFVFHNHGTTFNNAYTRKEVEQIRKKNTEIIQKQHSSFFNSKKFGDTKTMRKNSYWTKSARLIRLKNKIMFLNKK